MIRQALTVDEPEIIDLWNEVACEDGYKQMTQESFDKIIKNNKGFRHDLCWVLSIGDTVQGFLCGCTDDTLPFGQDAAYLTCLFIRKPYNTAGNYLDMLERFENTIRKYYLKKRIDVLFFNSMQIPWIIPGTDGHEHNNAPGVVIGSELHKALLDFDYLQRNVECGMYLNLKNFQIPDSIKAKEEELAGKGYHISLFEKNKQKHILKMAKTFNNPLWEKEVPGYSRKGTPILIADKEGEAIGFAGPAIKEASGRGYFSGIGVEDEFGGMGIGTVLFYKLCELMKQETVEYMSLFTGKFNPAKKIYEEIGFQTAKEFAIMRKEF